MYDIYCNGQNDAWRFALGKSGNRKLLTIGLNPSTATKEKSDTTVAKVERVAALNGFDGFIMLNLYPVRSTDFRALPRQVKKLAFQKNLDHIEATVAVESEPVIWAAWGESISAQSYFLAACVELLSRLSKYPVVWQRFGELTASGHPRHPSRLKYAWQFAPFATDDYTKILNI